MPSRHDEVIRRRTAETGDRCVSERAQQRRSVGDRLVGDQLDEDLRLVLAQQRAGAAQHSHLHAFHVDLEKCDWKAWQRGRKFGDQIIETPQRDGLAGCRGRARYDVARADVAIVFIAQGHRAAALGIADADRHNDGPVAQSVGVDVALQDRVKAWIGLDRHDMIGAEEAEEHRVVANVATHVEVKAATRSNHGDVLELIEFPERLLCADDVGDLVSGVVPLQAHPNGRATTRPPRVAVEASRRSTCLAQIGRHRGMLQHRRPPSRTRHAAPSAQGIR